jgi:xanthine dehydrogenase YagS FAD-binding subunit
MQSFDYVRADTPSNAVRTVQEKLDAKYLGGGTNLVDLMRENIEKPRFLVDVTALPGEISEAENNNVLIGAAAKNTAIAEHALIRERHPLVARAILAGASAQIRNMATAGGNLLQRTRCYYFYDDAAHCNKREPGSGCDALQGFNRIHAILGASPHCVATFPSDLCVALAALDAIVHVDGSGGSRQIPFTEFHRLPGDRPELDNVLEPGELITAIELPKSAVSSNAAYRKVRDRSSYAFALVSVAATMKVDDGKVSDVRIALGGVAHKPWRASKAEAAIIGRPANAETYRQAAEDELADAKPLRDNAFKVELAKRTMCAVLEGLSA